jgi:hypothetical protein
MSFSKSTVLCEDCSSIDWAKTKTSMVGYVGEGHNALLNPPWVIPFDELQYLVIFLYIKLGCKKRTFILCL